MPSSQTAAAEAMQPSSLLLASAAASGDGAAIDAIDAMLLAQVKRVVAGMPAVSSHHDDICQRVRERLLMPDAAGKRGIEQYSGCGPLETWLRTAALREAIRIAELKSETPAARASERELHEVASPDVDPELWFLKEHYRVHFREVFKLAAAELEPGQRAILRLSYLERMSVDQLALMYGVHRATAARRVAAARNDLMTAVRAGLGERLGLGDSELDSVLRLADTNLSISLSVLLPKEG